MKKYRLPIIIIIVFLIFILASYLLIQTNQQKELSPAIDAVPLDASFILETSDFTKLSSSIKNNDIWNDLIQISTFKKQNKQLNFIDSLFKKDFNILSNKNILISAHLQGKNKLHFLYLVSLPRTANQKRMMKKLEILLKDKATITERNHDNTKIFDVSFEDLNKKNNFSFSFSKGILIFSFSTLLAENSIRQIKSNNSIAIDYNFKQISKSVGKNVLANLYINYEHFPNAFKHLLSPKIGKKTKKINGFASWTAMDLSLDNTSINLNGFAYAGTNYDKFINIFTKQNPIKSNVAEILPEETSRFTSYGFSDKYEFKRNFIEYLKSHDLEYKWNLKNANFNKKYKIDIQKILFEILDNQITFAESNFSEYVILKVKSTKEAKALLTNITEVYCDSTKLKIEDYSTEYKLDKETKFTVYKSPIDNILNYAFENLHAIPEHKYYFLHENNIIFTDSYENLKKIIQTIAFKNNLQNSESFQNLSEQLTSKSNIFVYYNIEKSSGQNIKFLNNEMSEWYKINTKKLSKFQEFVIQFSSQSELFYTNMVLNYNPNAQVSNKAIWNTKLDAKILTKPFLLTNHYTFKKEIFVQDILNNIYLIDNNGKILFKKEFSEKIIGKIHQVEYYDNSKYQLLFNTANYIYIIDRNGNNIDGFPIKLESPATNSVAFFDYENNNDYRFFVACENKKVYLYQKDGTISDGWQKTNTETVVSKPIQHFNYQKKDYIIFSDKLNIYILDRKGNTRIEIAQQYNISQNSNFYFQEATQNKKAYFVTTNTKGEIVKIKLDGTITLDNTDISPEYHHFTYADINNDGKKDYIFTEKNHLTVLNNDLSSLYNYDFSNQITKAPIIFRFSIDDVKIGIVPSKENKIYLINNDGKLHKGFPLKGSTEFSVGVLNSQNNFNLIVGFIDKSIYNYQIE